MAHFFYQKRAFSKNAQTNVASLLLSTYDPLSTHPHPFRLLAMEQYGEQVNTNIYLCIFRLLMFMLTDHSRENAYP